MSIENNNNPAESTANQDQPKHESWIKHVVDEIKEEIAELVEEAQSMNPYEFPMLGDGHVNVVHDHHHDGEKKEEGA
jgi:hypothetical protein